LSATPCVDEVFNPNNELSSSVTPHTDEEVFNPNNELSSSATPHVDKEVFNPNNELSSSATPHADEVFNPLCNLLKGTSIILYNVITPC